MREKAAVAAICGLFLVAFCAESSAQTAKQVLDKTAAALTSKGGASASFAVKDSGGSALSGTIWFKGSMFKVVSSQLKIWFDGTTQWTYLSATDEVNITEPTPAQQQMLNPYKLITSYKDGYETSIASKGNSYVVTLKAQSANKAIQEARITVDKSSYHPSDLQVKQNGAWTAISVSNVQAATIADNLFVFDPKECPGAEIIDLR